jgi:DNA-binding protein
MDNYTRGKIVDVDDENLPFSNLSSSVCVLIVKDGSKMRNILELAIKHLKSDQHSEVVFKGKGRSIYKAISCAEILKRKPFGQGLHQMTRIGFQNVEEFWDPKDKALDVLKVVREIPCIHILLSKTPLVPSHEGYQAPGHVPYRDRGHPNNSRPKKQKGHTSVRTNTNTNTNNPVTNKSGAE